MVVGRGSPNPGPGWADTLGAMTELPAVILAALFGVQNVGTPAPSAPGATQQNTKVNTQPLQRIEGGVGDIDPLGVSLRRLSVDLRQPVGFGGVYQVPASASPTGRSQFARVSGATVAVFDQSTYAPTRAGPVATIAPGTVFYIGGLPQRPAARPASTNAVSTAVDTRAAVVADMGADAQRVQPQPVSGERGTSEPPAEAAAERVAAQWPQDAQGKPEEAGRPSTTGIWGDEAYRGARVRELLRAAADRLTEVKSKK